VILFYFAFCVLFLALLITEQDQFARRSHGPQCLRSALRRWFRAIQHNRN